MSGLDVRSRSEIKPWNGWRRLLAPLVALGLVLSLVPASPAAAAGPGVLSITVTPVHYITGAPLTSAAADTNDNRIAYRVSYSCAVATCTDTRVQFTPSQADPYNLAINTSWQALLNYENWTAPSTATGAPQGTNLTGMTFPIGDIPAGTSGSFNAQYQILPRVTGGRTAPGNFYPSGFQIVMGATASSPNAVSSVSATAPAVTWNNSLPTPTMSVGGPTVVKPGADATYSVAMNSGVWGRGISPGSIAGQAAFIGAGDYTVQLPLPPQAVFKSSTYGGVHTGADANGRGGVVTWKLGTLDAPAFAAAGGWTPSSPPGFVTVTYPAAAFPGADANGCNFEAPVTVTGGSATFTYLDTARTTKTALAAPSSTTVSCYEPFGRSTMTKDSTSDGPATWPRTVYIPPETSGYVCPAYNRDDWGRACTAGQPVAPFADNVKEWSVRTYNAGNAPGQATIVDDTLDQANAPVRTIRTSGAATIVATYQCGTAAPVTETKTAVTVTTLTAAQQADGCRYVSATITSGSLAPGNIRPQDTGIGTAFWASFEYTVSKAAPVGAVRTNTATTTMSYPGTTIAPVVTQATALIKFEARPVVPPPTTARPVLNANLTPGVVSNNGQAVPGRNVTFTVSGGTLNIPADMDITPQYAFIAPKDWVIVPDSASFPAGSVPAGVTYTTKTVTIAGATRQAIVATWPSTVVFGENESWPAMTVVAQPTFAVTPGTISTAAGWVGDSRHGLSGANTTIGLPTQDAPDVDNDGSTTEFFATYTQNVQVFGQHLVDVVKEICLPDDGGCTWVTDSTKPVPVSTTASDIRYRVTVTNTGNQSLTGIVAYDVLPYVGDMGTSDATAATPRGSTFDETLSGIYNVSPGLTLTYSESKNPPRPEVFSGPVTGTWGTAATGMQSLRAQYGGTLTPGQSVSFQYTADVSAGASADARACNSIAVDTAETIPSEPPAVCAVTAEADLEVTVPERLPLQEDRLGLVPFTVVNNGGSANAPATVDVRIPAGLVATSLTPAGWSCTAGSASAPITGPMTLSCQPVDAAGSVTTLPLDTPVALNMPVRPTAEAEEICVGAAVTGVMVDPESDNNEAEGCFRVFVAAPELSVTKTDGVETATPGQELTYTVTATNNLVGEAIPAVTLTDTLPAGAVFVGASDGGTHTGADAAGRGGTISWTVDLARAGTADGDGANGTGAAGSTITRTVTVRIDSGATGDVVNEVTASAADPADATRPLTSTDEDLDTLRRTTVSKSSNAAPSGVRPGDVVTYTVSMVNDGTVAFTAENPARLLDDLSAVLDDASYGEGTVSIGGAVSAIAPDGSGRLSWSGPLAIGEAVTFDYTVTVGDGADMRLTNTAWGSGTVGDSCTDGVDENGTACAVVASVFAPELGKRIESLVQNDDGTWSIVYAIDVTNPAPEGSTTYTLSDSLRFGAGIQVVSASASLPDGSTSAWAPGQSDTLATGVVIAAGAQHTYRVAVQADAGTTPGTAAAVCVSGATGGFGNSASLALPGRSAVTADACASPAEPTVSKRAAAPVQQADGTWRVDYVVSVANASRAAADLAYTLNDAFAFPAGVTVRSVTATGPGGATVDGFDGAAAASLTPNVMRIPAPTGTQTSITQNYALSVVVDAPLGSVAPADLLCGPAGTGGYANTATLFAGAGSTVSGTADACTAVVMQPMVDVSKRVLSSSVLPDGNWSLIYEVRVQNPDSEYASSYRLDDSLNFADGVTVVHRGVVGPADATIDGDWNGTDATAVLTAPKAIAAGAVDVYTVTVEADPGVLEVESPLADCRVDDGETGTGYRNIATVTVGTRSAFADACEPATDPSVVKSAVGQPEQNEDGTWTLDYTITVTNRSATTSGAIPYRLEDTLGFPENVVIEDVSVDAPTGASVDEDFDGIAVRSLGSHAIGAAPSVTQAQVQTWTVSVRFAVPAGLESVPVCDPQQGPGGLRNEIEIVVGARVSGAVACADVPLVPAPVISKTIAAQHQQADGTWAVDYAITVANPSTTAASRYTLGDEFALGDGITLAGASVDVPAGVEPSSWGGVNGEAISENVLLPAAGSHTYTVHAVIDAGAVTGDDPAGDCTMDTGETGSGFGNTVTLGTGVVDLERMACARAWDPGVTKELNGVPVQQPDGSWLLSYTMTVSNPSSLQLSYGLVDELSFPAESEVTVESASSRTDGPAVNPAWDGQTDLQLVHDGTALPADTVHVFDVTVRAALSAGQESVDGGWANSATVESGVDGVVASTAVATADLLLPELTISKTATPSAEFLRIGDTVDYTISIENTGEGDFTTLFPAVIVDVLSDVQDDAEVSTPVVAPEVGTVTDLGTAFRFNSELATGASVTITYTATIEDRGGDADLDNVAYAAEPLSTTAIAPDECEPDACASTFTPLAALQVTKVADADVVGPNGAVNYTVTVTNTGQADIPDGAATVTDDLSDVLDDAALVGVPAPTSGQASVSGETLTWSGGLAAGETSTITYSVRVHSGTADGAKLVNTITSDPTLLALLPGGGAAERTTTTEALVVRLAVTGGVVNWTFGALALLLLLAGAGVLLLRRRRRRTGESTNETV